MRNNNMKQEGLNEYVCKVHFSRYDTIRETIRAKTFENAVVYMKEQFPEATDICEADHWR